MRSPSANHITIFLSLQAKVKGLNVGQPVLQHHSLPGNDLTLDHSL